MTDEGWAVVTELMEECEPWQVFHVGWICGKADLDEVQPDRGLLLAVSKCSGIIGAETIYEHWKKLRRAHG